MAGAKILIGGVKYNSYEEGIAAFRQLSDVQLNQNAATDFGTPIGGRWLVVMPSLKTAAANYVGIIRGHPKQALIDTLAKTELIGLENRLRILERAHLVNSMTFVEEDSYQPGSTAGVDYIIMIRPQNNGDRSMPAAQLRKTDVILQNAKSGIQATAFLATGSLSQTVPAYLVQQFRAAAVRINGEGGHAATPAAPK